MYDYCHDIDFYSQVSLLHEQCHQRHSLEIYSNRCIMKKRAQVHPLSKPHWFLKIEYYFMLCICLNTCWKSRINPLELELAK